MYVHAFSPSEHKIIKWTLYPYCELWLIQLWEIQLCVPCLSWTMFILTWEHTDLIPKTLQPQSKSLTFALPASWEASFSSKFCGTITCFSYTEIIQLIKSRQGHELAFPHRQSRPDWTRHLQLKYLTDHVLLGSSLKYWWCSPQVAVGIMFPYAFIPQHTQYSKNTILFERDIANLSDLELSSTIHVT